MIKRIRSEWKHIVWPKAGEVCKRFCMVVAGAAVLSGLIWCVDKLANTVLGLLL